MGPVVDVEFKDGELPSIQDALKVNNGGKECVMEVSLPEVQARCPTSILVSISSAHSASRCVTAMCTSPGSARDRRGSDGRG